MKEGSYTPPGKRFDDPENKDNLGREDREKEKYVPVTQIPSDVLPPNDQAELAEYREAKERIVRNEGTEKDQAVVAEYEAEYKKAA